VAIEPVGYLDLLRLQASAELVVTDSGGLQEEAAMQNIFLNISTFGKPLKKAIHLR
jgi:UDP-N-acetylglucosamine 2-epimerase